MLWIPLSCKNKCINELLLGNPELFLCLSACFFNENIFLPIIEKRKCGICFPCRIYWKTAIFSTRYWAPICLVGVKYSQMIELPPAILIKGMKWNLLPLLCLKLFYFTYDRLHLLWCCCCFVLKTWRHDLACQNHWKKQIEGFSTGLKNRLKIQGKCILFY